METPKFFNSGYKKDKKRHGFVISRRIIEINREIERLRNLIMDDLPEDNKENIFKQLREEVRSLYEWGLPKTRNKKVVILGILLRLLITKIQEFELKKGNSEKILKYQEAILKLKDFNPTLFQKAKKIKAQLEEREVMKLNQSNKNENNWSYFRIAIEDIDPTYKLAWNDGFFDLLYKEHPYPYIKQVGIDELTNKMIQEDIGKIINASKHIADCFLSMLSLNERVQKREGLFCVSCYFYCKFKGYKIKSQSEWAKFFGISDSTFDKLYSSIKKDIVIQKGV